MFRVFDEVRSNGQILSQVLVAECDTIEEAFTEAHIANMNGHTGLRIYQWCEMDFVWKEL